MGARAQEAPASRGSPEAEAGCRRAAARASRRKRRERHQHDAEHERGERRGADAGARQLGVSECELDAPEYQSRPRPARRKRRRPAQGRHAPLGLARHAPSGKSSRGARVRTIQRAIEGGPSNRRNDSGGVSAHQGERRQERIRVVIQLRRDGRNDQQRQQPDHQDDGRRRIAPRCPPDDQRQLQPPTRTRAPVSQKSTTWSR